MKTMLELLIRLHELRRCCERAQRSAQVSDGEKAAICAYRQLVRECLPKHVLAHYDKMTKSERALGKCPEIFAMAVLVSAYRGLTPAGRSKLVSHFSRSSPVFSPGTIATSNRGIAEARAVDRSRRRQK